MKISKIDIHLQAGEKTIYNNDHDRLDFSFSPEILASARNWDSSEYTVTKLLCWLKSFNKRIQDIRARYSITKEPYPENSSLDQLIEKIYKKKTDHYQEIESDTQNLLVEYKLSENWKLSVQSALMFNTLLVPPDQHIFFHFPEKIDARNESRSKSLLSITNSPGMQRALTAIRLVSFPGIYFNRYTTPDELKKWIDKNAKLIRSIQKDLPSHRKNKAEKTTLFWGSIAWIWLKGGTKSWAEMAKKIEDHADKYVTENGEVDAEELLDPPNGVELERYYVRFIEYLRKLEPSST